MTLLATRIALVLVAIVALAWLGNEVRIMRLEDDAEAVLDRARAGKVPEADVKHAADLLESSRRLNPDQAPVITEGQLRYATGDADGAALLARSVTLDEPDNLQAWFLVWAAASDPAVKRQALTQLRRLNSWTDVALGLRGCRTCPLLKKPAY